MIVSDLQNGIDYRCSHALAGSSSNEQVAEAMLPSGEEQPSVRN